MARDELHDEGVVDDRAAAGLAHLQAAAREMIAAARALLDVAEGLVEDPDALKEVVGTVGAVVRHAAQAVVRPTAAADPDAGDDGGYQRIRLG